MTMALHCRAMAGQPWHAWLGMARHGLAAPALSLQGQMGPGLIRGLRLNT